MNFKLLITIYINSLKMSIKDFKWITSKFAENVNELTLKEIYYVIKFLEEYDCSEFGNESDLIGDDLFDNDCWITDFIYINYWSWNDKTLVDVFGWPGDNQYGCIYLDNKIVVSNEDGNLNASDDCPEELASQIKNLTHARDNFLYIPGKCKAHSFCIKQKKRYDSFIKKLYD